MSPLAPSAAALAPDALPERLAWRLRQLLRRYLLHYAAWYRAAHSRQSPQPDVDRFLLAFLEGRPLDAEEQQLHQRLEAALQQERGGRGAAPPDPGQRAAVAQRYERVVRSLELDALSADLLLLLLGPELDGGLWWMLHLLSEERGPGLSLTLARHLLDPAGEAPEALAAVLAPGGPLASLGLVELDEERDGGASGRVRLGAETARYLAGGGRALEPCPSWALSVWSQDECAELAQQAALSLAGPLAQVEGRLDGARLLIFEGSAGKGAAWLAAAVAQRRGCSLLRVEGAALVGLADLRPVLCELVLRQAALLVEEWPAEALGPAQSAKLLRFFRSLQSLPLPSACLRVQPGTQHRFLGELHLELGATQMALELGSPEDRARWWRTGFGRRAPEMEQQGWGEALRPLVEAEWGGWTERLRVYPLGVEDLDRALLLGLARCDAQSGDATDLLAGVETACQQLVLHHLGELATRVTSTLTWNEVLFSQKVLDGFAEVRSYAQHFETLVQRWGWKRRLPSGRGLSVLLSGASGTGKTTAAALLARDLGIELFQVDLSRVVSKYIGETEERMARLFDEAKAAGAGLLFDEADSLFSGRTDVKTSVDRYANQEVNFLLERIESHPGVAFLTTNRPESLDEAFLRRIKFHVVFEEPSRKERAALWRALIPEETPRSRSIRFDELASRFELNPGHIRNAVLRATLRAAAKDRPLTMADLVQAAQALYGELGKLVREDD